MLTKLNNKQLSAYRAGYRHGYEEGVESVPSHYDDEQRAAYETGYDAGVADYCNTINTTKECAPC